MTRVARPVALDFDLHLALVIGPVEGDDLSVDDLAVAWVHHRDTVMEEYVGPRCTRPWGFWRFELGEEPPRPTWNSDARKLDNPHAETLRLAEVGELTDAELAALRERANEARLRVGTDRERLADSKSVDAPSIELWEQVRELMGGLGGVQT